jgi:hypothetical protein
VSILDDLVTLAEDAGINRVYAIGSVPATPTYPYVVVGADTGTPGLRRVGGGSTRKERRVTVQVFGRTTGSVLNLADLADDAFEDKVLSALDGGPFSMRELQTGILRDPDDNGVLSILHTYKLLEA